MSGLLTSLALSREEAGKLRDMLIEKEVEIERLMEFLRRFLNPEDLAMSVPPHIRDDVRELLGMKRCEE